MKNYLWLLSIFILSACIPQPTLEPTPTNIAPLLITKEENPYEPHPEDLNMIQAGVILTSLDLSEVADTSPLRTELTVLGSMPSVCNELRINVNPPDENYQIAIDIYSIIDPTISCDNVFQQFEANIVLGEYSAGQYSIWVNGSFVGDMVSY
jgi:hypothetical protein